MRGVRSSLVLLLACEQPLADAQQSCASGGQPSAPAVVTLTDATQETGLPTRAIGCLAFEDFDVDGRADLLLGAIGEADFAVTGPGRLDLYRNQGDETFHAHAVPLPGATDLTAACDVADFDNDGLPDIVVSVFPGDPDRIALLRNMGNLTFEDATSLLPVSVRSRPPPTVVGFVDYDADGWLDLFLNFVPASHLHPDQIACEATDDDFTCHLPDDAGLPPPGALLRNHDGVFAELPAPSSSRTNVIGFLDWDGDGFIDVFASNDFASNTLWRNVDGSGRFEDIAGGLGLGRYNHGMGSAFGDFDRDGRWDLYVADAGPDQFYFGLPDGTMEDRAARLGIGEWTRFHSGWAPLAADFNQDGRLDLFVVNSALVGSSEQLADLAAGRPPLRPGPQADYLYVANDIGGFNLTLLPHAPGARPMVLVGITAVADYDGDGDLDIAELYLAPWTFRLLRNDTASQGRWLAIDLEGRTVNRDARGASVELLGGDGVPFDRRAAHGMSGSVGRSWGTLHFGLGDRDCVQALRVRWPGGGVQEVPGPWPADRVVQVVEP